MKKSLFCLAALCASVAHAHSDADSEVGTTVSAAISATWRDDGVILTDGAWQIPGVLMGGEAYPVEENAAVDEASLTLQHRAASGIHGLLQISSHDNGSEAEVHHAYAGYDLALAGTRLNLEGGRMAAAMTPSNGEHASARLFSETPLVLDAFLGRQLNDEGLRAQWRWHGFELGAESWRGSAFPATSGEDGGSHDVYLHHKGHVGTVQWYTGIWWLQADALNRQDTRYSSGHTHGTTTTVTVPEAWFDGRTRISGAFLRLDAALSTNLHWLTQIEGLQLEAEGDLRDSTREVELNSEHNGGWIQTSLRWQAHEAGVRWERLALDNELTGAAASVLATEAGVYTEHDPTRTTALYSWHASPSFRVRVEWTRDETQSEAIDRIGVGLVWQETLWSQR